ncbi:hypothetical protein EIP91_010253 [Steccherinum ochraceum]|uniref:Uncharacterized protein n=1 Tax=Steccherinum ochraceum TaxID=92696 RepID=A0A4R0R0T5_9APHY|nr:hypothetical protein EIP91_010253 [Steccherinum ochraceum]
MSTIIPTNDLETSPIIRNASDSPSLISKHLLKRISLTSGHQDSTSSLASENYYTAESASLRSASLESIHDGSSPLALQILGESLPPPPTLIITTVPTVQIQGVEETSPVSLLSSGACTPRPPGWEQPPPSPTLSATSSIHFAAPLSLREPRPAAHAGVTSLGLLSIGSKTQRRKMSVSSGSNMSTTDEEGDNGHLQLQLVPSRISTAGTRTHVDEPGDSGAGGGGKAEVAGVVEVVKEVVTTEADVMEVPAPTGSALAKFRKAGKLAGRARRIIRRIWRVDAEVTVVQVGAVTERTTMSDAVKPILQEVSTSKKVPQPTEDAKEDLIEARLMVELDQLKAEMDDLRARLLQAEHGRGLLDEEMAGIKNSLEEMRQDAARKEPVAADVLQTLELCDLAERLKNELASEKRVRKQEIFNLHRIHRETLLGR